MVELTDGQKKAVAGGITSLAAMALGAFVFLLGWCMVKAIIFLSPAISPLIVGLFLALFFKPYYEWWLKLVKNPTLAVLLMLASVLVPFSAVLWHFGSIVAGQLGELAASAPQRAAKLTEWFNATFPNAQSIADRLGIPYAAWADGFKNELTSIAAGAASYVSSFLNWLVSLVLFVFFLTRPAMRGTDVVKEMPFLKDDTKNFVAELIDAFTGIVVGFFQRQTVICLLEGIYYGAGFAISGVRFGFITGFALGVLNLVPLFGTIVCLPVALTMAYFGADGSTLKLCMVVAVWLAGQILDGYLVTPKIQGEKTGLGYAGVIFSFFFWGVVFKSFVGLLLAIPLSAFFIVFWRALKSRYIKPLV